MLILGDMLELGNWSEREHAAIIEMAAQDPEAELLLVGPEFAKAYDGLAEKPANVTLCPTRDDLISLLRLSPSGTPSSCSRVRAASGWSRRFPNFKSQTP